jgi:hypothetical protein
MKASVLVVCGAGYIKILAWEAEYLDLKNIAGTAWNWIRSGK